MLGAPAPAPRSRRPLGIALLAGGFAVVTAVWFVMILVTVTAMPVATMSDRAATAFPPVLFVYVLVGPVSAFVTYGLWCQRRWGWYGGVLVASVLVLVGVFGLFATGADAHAAAIALALVLAWGLFRPRVRAWLGVREVPGALDGAAS